MAPDSEAWGLLTPTPLRCGWQCLPYGPGPSCTKGGHMCGAGLPPSSAHYLHGPEHLVVSRSTPSTCAFKCSGVPAPGGQGLARGQSWILLLRRDEV